MSATEQEQRTIRIGGGRVVFDRAGGEYRVAIYRPPGNPKRDAALIAKGEAREVVEGGVRLIRGAGKDKAFQWALAKACGRSSSGPDRFCRQVAAYAAERGWLEEGQDSWDSTGL